MRTFHHRVRFLKSHSAHARQNQDQKLEQGLPRKSGHSTRTPLLMASPQTEESPFVIAGHFLQPPVLQDALATETSDVQADTLDECLPLLSAANSASSNPFDYNEFGIPDLRKDDHINFLEQNLARFPTQFVGLDASRPWMFYWGLVGLHLLGEDVSLKGPR